MANRSNDDTNDTDGHDGWTNVRGRADRRRRGGGRDREASRKYTEQEELGDQGVGNGPLLNERFNQRAHGRRNQQRDNWMSEHEQTTILTDKLRHLGMKREARTDDFLGGFAPRNELVSKFENETTDHFTQGWRKLPEIPTKEELLQEGVELSCNVTDAPYDSVEEYLQTHYELLREDSIAGLREAIQYVRECPSSDDTHDVSIYENVTPIGLTFAQSLGLCCKVSFSLARAGKRIRWAQSRRLIPGSLVALSDDDFQTFKLATVAARPLVGLETNPPEIDLLFEPNEVEINAAKPMLMVESRNGYFEANKWVLKALQRMTDKNFVLSDQICFLDKTLQPPAYVQSNPRYDLTSIFPDNKDKEATIEVDILGKWPNTTTSMDESQIKALKSILTNNVSVIQGPPGTGKTFTSVMALHAMLRNMAEGDPPIVVACQTNHALDQLLRHVYKFEGNIARLGGRTQDQGDILKRTMFHLRRKTVLNVQGSGYSRCRTRLDRLADEMTRMMAPLCSEFISPEHLLELNLINADQKESIEKGLSEWVQAKDNEKLESPIARWLQDSIVEAEVFEDIGPEEEDEEIEYEALKDKEAEFLGFANENDEKEEKDRDALTGRYISMKHNFFVRAPIGISEAEIEKAARKKNLWDLPDHLRATLYLHWEQEATRKILGQMTSKAYDYARMVKELKIAKMERDSAILSNTKLVGMTTTGLSKYRSLVAATCPRVVLIEEAAEAVEGPIAAACMPSVQHLILVGDHKQLRPKCAVNELENDPYFLNISLFERWVENQMPYVALRTQRRMRPEIRELLVPIYEDQLIDHPSVMGRDPIQGMGGVNVFWHCHSVLEKSADDSPSKVNHYEAEMITQFVKYLVFNGVAPAGITILTFYTGQRAYLQKCVYRNPNLRSSFIKIVTVDSYQGEENDVVILSLVRSNPDRKIGFLSNANRVCVAISRAQRGFYVFGNAQIVTNVDRLWWDIADVLNKTPPRIGFKLPLSCFRHKAVTYIQDINDWIENDGGCRRPCRESLPCGHKCPLKCHPFDHDDYRCLENCNRVPMPCGHRCEEECWKECYCARCKSGRDELEALMREQQQQREDGGASGEKNWVWSPQAQAEARSRAKTKRVPKRRATALSGLGGEEEATTNMNDM